MPSTITKRVVKGAIDVDSKFASLIFPILREIQHPMHGVRRRRILLRSAKMSGLIGWLEVAEREGLFGADIDLDQYEKSARELFSVLTAFWSTVDKLWDSFGRECLDRNSLGANRLNDLEAYFFDLGSPWNCRRFLWHRAIFAFYAGLALKVAESAPAILSSLEVSQTLDEILRLAREYNPESESAPDIALQVFLCWVRIDKWTEAMSV